MKAKLLDIGLLVLRVGAGGFMATHGFAKVANFSEMSSSFPDPLGFLGSTGSLVVAIFAELVCALAVAVGLFTRWAALPVCATMFVAAFLVHGSDPFAKKELALLYLVVFAFLAMSGGGKFTLDGVIKRWRASG
jgi:putative oxidoreductase